MSGTVKKSIIGALIVLPIPKIKTTKNLYLFLFLGGTIKPLIKRSCMSNDYKDICKSIERLERTISKLPKDFKDNRDTREIAKMLEKQLKEFQKSNKFEIQKEIGNSKQFQITLILSVISTVISLIALFTGMDGHLININ